MTRLLALLNAALSGGTAVALLYIPSMRPCATLGKDDAFCHRLLVTCAPGACPVRRLYGKSSKYGPYVPPPS